MQVVNIHRRALRASAGEVGHMLDSLSSQEDAIWPSHSWPKMKLDRPLSIGAAGGHGPVRYLVQEYISGKRVKFRFTSPKGFNGWHALEVETPSQQGCQLTHTISMNTTGLAVLLWPLIFKPLHDALLEDGLSKAQASVGESPQENRWSAQVKLLRWLLSARRPSSRGA